MADSLHINQKAFRACILNEFLRGRPVYESYKNLCGTLGNDNIDYREFDVWYHRFADGKLDLSYERSPASEPRLFSEVPIEMIEEIICKLEFKEQIIIRRVSRTLQTLVDQQKSALKEISCIINNSQTTLKFDKDLVKYCAMDDGCSVEYEERKKIFKNENHWDKALNDMASAMKNLKLQLRLLRIEIKIIDGDRGISMKMCHEKVKSAFESLNRQLHVEKVEIEASNSEVVLSILPYLKCGTLRSLDLELEDPFGKEVMAELDELDQWKQTRYLKIGAPILAPITISEYTEDSFEYFF